MKPVIIPSIIAKNQKEFDERFAKVKNISDVFQLDIMDGKFVKNKSLMFPLILPKRKKYEAHLMMKNPKKWIEKNYRIVDTIIIYPDSFKTEEEFIEAVRFIKSKKKGAGMAINPNTPILRVSYINLVSLILIMTVNPGKYGARFIPKSLKWIENMRKFRPKKQIEVDGGINDKTISKALKAGANRFVIGSFLQNSKDVNKDMKKLKGIVK